MSKKQQLLAIILIWSGMIFQSLAGIPGYEEYVPIQPLEKISHEGTLILSNSPETVKKEGILYQDTFIGEGRIVFHHVNAMNQQVPRLMISVKNETSKGQLLMIKCAGYAKPQYNYLEAGSSLLENYYQCHQSKVIFLSPDQEQTIFISKPQEWEKNMVLSGMLDVYATGKLQITFLASHSLSKPYLEGLQPLKKDMAPRGTFKGLIKEQYVYIPTGQKSYYLIEDEQTDWVKGWDALTKEPAINYGNYGVLYKIQLIAGADTEVFICPRGGIFRGILRWEDDKIILIDRPHVFKNHKERVNIGKIKQGETRTLEYMLPNGSAAPILIGFKES